MNKSICCDSLIEMISQSVELMWFCNWGITKGYFHYVGLNALSVKYIILES